MNYTGFLNVYKEKGMTSMSVCARIRRILHVDKAGHAGTLDPMAEGVLPVALGRACKSVEEVGDGTKIYEAGMLLGYRSDTQDITGKILGVYDRELPDEDTVRQAILSFAGGYDQLTPMYSARQVDGRRLYEIARSGEEVERNSKKIEILSIRIDKMELPHVVFTVQCSRGTYIRTLCNDIGELLGCGAVMESLKRTAVGDFLAEDALSFEDIEQLEKEGRVDTALRVVTGTAVAVGKFDGTHKGHQALLKELRKAAEKNRLRSLVLIVEPEGKGTEDREERRERLLSLGIDYVLELPLTKELYSMSAEDFLEKILIRKLSMKYLVGGKDISFGKDRRGNEEFLRKNAAKYGFHFKLIDKVKIGVPESQKYAGTGENRNSPETEKEISSTLLREKLSLGEMESVEKLLGHPYTLKGEVVHGRNIGSSLLGIPTCNITVSEDLLLPPYGVYASRITVFGKEDRQTRNDHTAPHGKNDRVFSGISNLGVKPSINDGKDPVSLETFLFPDTASDGKEVGDLYGKTIRVELLEYLRPEKRFSGLEELRQQMVDTDLPQARSVIAERNKAL